MEDLQAKVMNDSQLARLHRTISSDAFYTIVMHHVLSKKGMSSLRLGDFEPIFLWRYPRMQAGLIQPFGDSMTEQNYRHLGVHGIDKDLLRERIMACSKADYLGFNVSGYLLGSFDPSPWFEHPRLFDTYFSNNWTKPMIKQLLERASGTVMINRDESLGSKLKAKANGAAFLKLNDWRDTERVCAEACGMPHQLVLLSGGSAGKYIGIELAKSGKVVLDVGQSAWCFVA